MDLPAAARAWSYILKTTALIAGFTFSTRAIAASSSSSGVTSRRRTSSAWAVASSEASSVSPVMGSIREVVDYQAE